MSVACIRNCCGRVPWQGLFGAAIVGLAWILGQIPWHSVGSGAYDLLYDDRFPFFQWLFSHSDSYRLQKALETPISLPAMSLPYVPHPVIVKDLSDAMSMSGGQFGALVYWLPQGGGKTTSLYHVADSVKKMGRRGVIIPAKDKIPDNQSIQDWVLQQMGVKSSQPGTYGISGMLKKLKLPTPVFIVIDRFDDFHFHPSVKEFVTNTAADSYETETFVLILAIRDLTWAAEVVGWNGREKMNLLPSDPHTHRWNATMMNKLLLSGSPLMPKKDVLSLCLRSGAPGCPKKYLLGKESEVTEDAEIFEESRGRLWNQTDLLRPRRP